MKAILTKFRHCTITKPSRIKAYDCDGNHVWVSWDEATGKPHPYQTAEYAAHYYAANKLMEKMDWTQHSLIGGAIKGGYAFVLTSK